MTGTLTPVQHAERDQLEHDLAAAGHRNVHRRSDETAEEHHARLVSIETLARLRNPQRVDVHLARVRINSPETPSTHDLVGIDLGPLTCWCETCDQLVDVANTRRIRLPNGRVANFHTTHLDYQTDPTRAA